MNEAIETVYVVEDDESFRRALSRLLEAHEFKVRAFTSAEEFLAGIGEPGPGCLILDVHLPGLNGLDLHSQLMQKCPELPVIFLTGHGDIPMSVEAIKKGAFDFLAKPVRAEVLADAVRRAFERNVDLRREHAELRVLRERYDTLSPREKEVMALVVSGRMNKQTAAELGITERTIKAHRAQIMAKMQLESLADLVRAAGRLEPGT
jgi:FixJ family two-component response regulator